MSLNPVLPIEKRLAILEFILLILALLIWFLFTDRTRYSLSETLFWVGVSALGIGVALICGAWRGYRDPDIDYILGPSLERAAQSFQEVKNAYSYLNVFALAGCITMILSLLVYL